MNTQKTKNNKFLSPNRQNLTKISHTKIYAHKKGGKEVETTLEHGTRERQQTHRSTCNVNCRKC